MLSSFLQFVVRLCKVRLAFTSWLGPWQWPHVSAIPVLLRLYHQLKVVLHCRVHHQKHVTPVCCTLCDSPWGPGTCCMTMFVQRQGPWCLKLVPDQHPHTFDGNIHLIIHTHLQPAGNNLQLHLEWPSAQLMGNNSAEKCILVRKQDPYIPDTVVNLTRTSQNFRLLPGHPSTHRCDLWLQKIILRCFWNQLQLCRCIQDATIYNLRYSQILEQLRPLGRSVWDFESSWDLCTAKWETVNFVPYSHSSGTESSIGTTHVIYHICLYYSNIIQFIIIRYIFSIQASVYICRQWIRMEKVLEHNQRCSWRL